MCPTNEYIQTGALLFRSHLTLILSFHFGIKGSRKPLGCFSLLFFIFLFGNLEWIPNHLLQMWSIETQCDYIFCFFAPEICSSLFWIIWMDCFFGWCAEEESVKCLGILELVLFLFYLGHQLLVANLNSDVMGEFE